MKLALVLLGVIIPEFIFANMRASPKEPSWTVHATQMDQAWKKSQGSREVIVAVIDTGVDVHHRDLKNNIWVNPGESGQDTNGQDKRRNGKDDDGNGLIDDVHGWNFVSNSNDVLDDHGHGTHIAGIIGGHGKIRGVSPRVSLMILKYYSPTLKGGDNIGNTVKAIRYAVKQGASIINYSAGGPAFSRKEMLAIEWANRQGVLFVAAAGNEASNSDKHSYYPADYEIPNIISVAAMDAGARVISSSNFGVRTVDIAAPGEEIFSTLPGNKYGTMTGTSQATAYVTGVAALVQAQNPTKKDVTWLKGKVLGTGRVQQGLAGKVGTHSSVNAFRALVVKGQQEGAVSGEAVQEDNIGQVSSLKKILLSKIKKRSQQPKVKKVFSSV